MSHAQRVAKVTAESPEMAALLHELKEKSDEIELVVTPAKKLLEATKEHWLVGYFIFYKYFESSSVLS